METIQRGTAEIQFIHLDAFREWVRQNERREMVEKLLWPGDQRRWRAGLRLATGSLATRMLAARGEEGRGTRPSHPGRAPGSAS